MTGRAPLPLQALLFFLLSLCAVLWLGSHLVQAKWPGVPPVPSEKGAIVMALGDRQLSFRMGSLTLQHLGDDGGRVTPLKNYDYTKLDAWFWLLRKLDPASDHVPLIAAYYFGATREPAQAEIVAKYLGEVGQNPSGEKWRWLAHAVFLARYRANDLDLALALAYKLAALQLDRERELPIWARQMPAFVLTARGEKDAARAIMGGILLTDKHLKPQEINFIKGFLAERLGVDESAPDAKDAAKDGK